ncbi:MAG: hypothetical protein ACR2MM_13990 [Flavobacteriaceae bacterium]
MKKALFILTIILFLASCGGVKRTQEAVNSGNYIQAINRAINNLAENKTKKSHQPYIILLEDAFEKYTQREIENIRFLEKDGNPANFEAIYNSYSSLKQIQERIRPLLPLPIFEENRNADFYFGDYDSQLLAAKTNLSEYLYAHASNLLVNATYKQDFRQAYEDFKYLEEINPGYSDTKEKMESAYNKGLDYVKVNVINDTEQIVPQRLEEELLNFNTLGLNDLWTQYHTNPLKDIKYDYEMQVAFRDISISPEQIREKQLIQEKRIRDGFDYVLDDNGNVMKDSLGNDIKVDRFKNIQCNFYEFTQFKAAQVVGNVSYIDLSSKQQLNSYPLSSEFVFQHVYANYQGDKRAIETDLMPLLQVTPVPFPSNEQMVYEAGEDLKSRLKEIIVRHKFQ